MLEGFDLSGRVAVVTGGGTGIGRDAALLLAERGADVVVAGRRPEPLEKTAEDIRALGRRALAVPSDLRKAEAAKALIEAAAKEFGRVDILINNAGGAHAHIGLAKMDLAMWDRDIQMNLSAAQYCSQAAFPWLKKNGGAIVNVSSMAGVNGTSGAGAYSAAKAGLQMLTRVMASEWGPSGIRVNCVAPGMTATEASRLNWEKQGYDPSAASKQSFALGRYGEMREVSQAIVFFASDAASYVTGETLAVGGGQKLGGMVDPDSDVAVPSPQTATL